MSLLEANRQRFGACLVTGRLGHLLMLQLVAVATFGASGLVQAQTFSATGMGGGIPDHSLGIFTVQLPSGIVGICDLELDITGITHANPTDLDIFLIDPFGAAIEIMTDRGGTLAVSGVSLTFSDVAGAAPSEAGPLVSGTFLPEGLAELSDQGFATYDGNDGGTDPWVLLVVDDTVGNTGNIASFTLRGSYGPPVCSPYVGACCDGMTGVCTDGVKEPLCTGDQQFWTVGRACAELDPPCDRPRGSCCDGTTGLCVDGLLPEDCSGDQLDWLQDVACAQRSSPCSEHTGACCDRLTGTCTPETVESACVGPQRGWTKGAACAEVTCFSVNGACCDHDPFGGCSETTNPGCQGDGLVWHKLMTCAQIECVHTVIPTVSEWGSVILTLLLLIGAKVHSALRQTATASEG